MKTRVLFGLISLAGKRQFLFQHGDAMSQMLILFQKPPCFLPGIVESSAIVLLNIGTGQLPFG